MVNKMSRYMVRVVITDIVRCIYNKRVVCFRSWLRRHTPGIFHFIGFFNNLVTLFLVTA